MCNITLTLFRLSPLSRQIGQSKWMVPPGFDPRTSRTPSTWPKMPSQPVPANWCSFIPVQTNWSSFIPSLDDVIGLGIFYRLRATSHTGNTIWCHQGWTWTLAPARPPMAGNSHDGQVKFDTYQPGWQALYFSKSQADHGQVKTILG